MKTHPLNSRMFFGARARARFAALAGIVALGLGAAHGVAQTAPAAAVQLLPNGDFESATQDPNWPDHWSRPNAGSFSWDAEGGKRYLRLNVTEPGQVVLSYRSVTIPAGVKALQLSLRARVIGLKCGPQAWFDARVMTDFKTKDGAKLKGAKSISFRKDTGEWVDRSVRFAVPDGAAALEIMPSLFQAYSGTFDLDEILLVVIDPAELAPAPVATPATPAASAAQAK